ncbi:hypothetical protein Dimus_022455 [Dionaea muscipula]
MLRGSPSPPSTFHRRPAPSLGPRARHLRSPSPLLCSSADLAEVSSSEEEDHSEAGVTSSEAEDSGDEEGKLFLYPVSILSPIVEENEIRLGYDGDRLDSFPVTALISPLEMEPSSVEDLVLVVDICPPCCGSKEFLSSSMADVPTVQRLLGRDSMDSPSSTMAPMHAGSGLRSMKGRVHAPAAAGVSTDVGEQSSAACGQTQAPSASVSSWLPSGVSDPSVAALVGGGEVIKAVQGFGRMGSVQLGDTVHSCVPLLPLCCDSIGLCGGGLVSEEARVSPVAREALRSQPTDGLRQPPSSPVVPSSTPLLLTLNPEYSSSSEVGDSTEAAVSSTEDEDRLDCDGGRHDSSRVLSLSPILEKEASIFSSSTTFPSAGAVPGKSYPSIEALHSEMVSSSDELTSPLVATQPKHLSAEMDDGEDREDVGLPMVSDGLVVAVDFLCSAAASVSSSSSPSHLLADAGDPVCGVLVSEVGSRVILKVNGLVSEEVAHSLAARAALRPQPADGLR